MVSPLRGYGVGGDVLPGVARRWRAASPRVTYGVALRAFWDTTTYTNIGYIVVNEKLNFLPKRVYQPEAISKHLRSEFIHG